MKHTSHCVCDENKRPINKLHRLAVAKGRSFKTQYTRWCNGEVNQQRLHFDRLQQWGITRSFVIGSGVPIHKLT